MGFLMLGFFFSFPKKGKSNSLPHKLASVADQFLLGKLSILVSNYAN
jgi:hypothetical protein